MEEHLRARSSRLSEKLQNETRTGRGLNHYNDMFGTQLPTLTYSTAKKSRINGNCNLKRRHLDTSARSQVVICKHSSEFLESIREGFEALRLISGCCRHTTPPKILLYAGTWQRGNVSIMVSYCSGQGEKGNSGIYVHISRLLFKKRYIDDREIYLTFRAI